MSKPAQILDQLKTQLQGSSYLSWVNDDSILIADRNIESHSLPCIFIEYTRNQEEISDVNHDRIDGKLTLTILGHIQNEDDATKITGDTSPNYGIARLENDIKKAIFSDPYINDLAIYTATPTTEILSEAGDPIVSLAMEVVIDYEQEKTSRT